MRRIIGATVVFAICAAFVSTQGISRDGGTAPDQVEENPTADRLEFEYQFGIQDASGRNRFVGQLPALTSGARFSVRVRSAQPVVAYMFVTAGEGEYVLMSPEDGNSPAASVARNRWMRVPDEEAVMRLDNRVGVERLYLIVARRPLREIHAHAEESGAITEEWLQELKHRWTSAARWERRNSGESIRVVHTGGGAAVEEIAFRHRAGRSDVP